MKSLFRLPFFLLAIMSFHGNVWGNEARSLTENYEVPGSAYIRFSEQALLFEQYLGHANEAKATAVSANTLFYLHSLSKPVLGALTIALIKEGVFGFDTPMSTLLPAMHTFCKKQFGPRCEITIRQLLLHTSGFDYPALLSGKGGNSERYDKVFSFSPVVASGFGPGVNLSELATQAYLAPLNQPPGEAFTYGIGYDLLGQAIENATSQSLETTLKQRLLGPLGIADLYILLPEGEKSRAVQLYNRKYATYPIPGKYRRYQAYDSDRLLITRPDYPISGGGGMLGTAHAYVQFLQAVLTGLNGKLSKEESDWLLCNQLPDSLGDNPLKAAFFDADDWGYSFGFGVRPSKTSAQCSSALFWSGYSNTQFSFDLRRGEGELFLTNLFPLDHNIRVALDAIR